ncbi:zinc transporter 9 [Nilaparvata lugens]|uniref:zinc transporter 9 n=1 Tax=Nilaparvata lugens TaxID=108931 RepID=UPI00193E54DE|nr:zinc transporter 9 [Nilaparvata lugens]
MIPRSQFKFAKRLLHTVSKQVFDPANRNHLNCRFSKSRGTLFVISDRTIVRSSIALSDIKNLPGSKSEGDALDKRTKSSSEENDSNKDQLEPTAKAAAVEIAKELANKLAVKATGSEAELRVTELLKDKETSNNTGKKVTAVAAAPKRQRSSMPRVDLSASSVERNFITPVRAMSDFLLKPAELEDLRPSKRRSPYENEPPIIVYWRKDVEAKAIEKWGSLEVLEKEKLQRELERKYYEQTIFATKRRMRDFRRDVGSQADIIMAKTSGLSSSSGRVVLTAVAINGTNFIFKLCAWRYTGSHSMFSETIHSLADTINQLILAYGIHKSVQRANQDHPYGYTHMKYVASLISGVGIFCVGTGLSLYHGITGLMNPEPMDSFYWAYFVLAGSFVSEGATSLVAFNSIKKGALEHGMSFTEYVLRGKDPSVNVVLLEDLAAVAGVMVAGVCMGLSSHFDSVIPDAIGSLLVGGILGAVASFIIYTNVAALLGRSIPEEYLNKINTELESDVMIRAIYDVKGIDIGNSLIRYKAELDFDGRELTRSYLDKQDLNSLLEEVKGFNDIDQVESFMIKHSEAIVDMMGGEIDRIEMKLRRKFPDIRHCDLEIL